MSIRVILADDHAMVRQGLRSVIEHDRDMEVVGEAGDGATAIKLAEQLKPVIVVLDFHLPDINGVEVTRRILQSGGSARVLALSAYSDRRYVIGMLDAGASGYLVKTAVGEELIRAIRTVAAGRRYLSSKIGGVDMSDRPDGAGCAAAMQRSAFPTLGPRERQVLRLLAEGNPSKDIACRLNISPRTVEAHRRNIMRKLDLHSIAELTKYAIREGLTHLED